MKKEINLVYPDKSDIKFKIQRFPDLQTNVVIDKKEQAFHRDTEVIIKSRLNSFEDLALIVCTVKCFHNMGVKLLHLYTPYFMGARSDRKFEEGGNNYLKDVICPIINSLNFESVTILDSHSSVLEACLNNFKSINNEMLVRFSLEKIYNSVLHNNISNEEIDKISDRYVLVSPDAGANHKIYKLAEQISYKGDIITCSKERDSEGKLTKCVVPFNINCVGKDFILLDDIFDGGNTFINISKEAKKQYGTDFKLFLIITHGIFSGKISDYVQHFDGIYTTNSYKEQIRPKFETNKEQALIKQLNVF